jgi:hypothetical protein
MTIIEAINRIDSLKHNTFRQEEKIRWLSQVDGQVYADVIATHEGGISFQPYDDRTSLEQMLLVPEPYDELYLHYLEAQMAYYQDEADVYNRAMSMYQALLTAFTNHYNRTHMPLAQRFRYF